MNAELLRQLEWPSAGEEVLVNTGFRWRAATVIGVCAEGLPHLIVRLGPDQVHVDHSRQRNGWQTYAEMATAAP